MDTASRRRSTTLVDSEVQGGLIRRVALHWILFFCCNAVALALWIRLFEHPDVSWSATLGLTLRRFLPFFVVTIALIPAFAWDTLKLSHRFAGPITRLHNTLQDLKQGRAVPPLRFRDSDYWQSIASDFNEVMRLRTDSGFQAPDPEEREAEQPRESIHV